MMEESTMVEGGWLNGMWKFLVEVKLKEDSWGRCHNDVVWAATACSGGEATGIGLEKA